MPIEAAGHLFIFFRFKPAILEDGVCAHGHQCVAMQSLPGSALEVVETEVLELIFHDPCSWRSAQIRTALPSHMKNKTPGVLRPLRSVLRVGITLVGR
jgi:hypothetical protein